MRWIIAGLITLAAVGMAGTQPQPNPPQVEPPIIRVQHGRGRVAPPQAVLDARHAERRSVHHGRMRALPTVTLAAYDLRTLGCVPPIKNQGSCGSCYQFGGADTCEIAMMKAGIIPVDGGGLAEQYGMDCHNWGGCGGGDEADVIAWCKSDGLPLTKDYGPYQSRSSSCRLKTGTKLWQIKDWGYCHLDQGQGVAAVEQIKAAMVQFGPISVALDAGGFDNYNGGVLAGTGHSIDHAVMLIGWDDSKGRKGAWLLRNQWGTSWGGLGGYMWIEYGAYDVGTEAIWVSVNELPIPPGPVPPVPPIPPTPGQLDTITWTINGKTSNWELFPIGTRQKLQELRDLIGPMAP